MDDWDDVSSLTEDTGKTHVKDAVPILRPQRPSVKRRLAGSSIAIIVLSVAVIGLSVLAGLSLFHVLNFNIAAGSRQLASVADNPNTIVPPNGTYLLTQGCPTSENDFYIVNAKTGLVMDVSGASREGGASVLQYPDNGGGTNQLWQFVSAGTGSYFKIENVNSGLVLDAPGLVSGVGIIVQNPDNGGLSQQWQCVFTSGHHFKIVNASSGLVLDIPYTNLTQIEPLQQDSYTGALNQQWLFVS